MSDYEMTCPNCHEDIVLCVDGYKLMDSDCPECGAELDYEDISIDLISGWSC